MINKKIISISLTALLISVIVFSDSANASIIRVNKYAPGGNGSTWASAYNSLWFALSAANTGDEIWVAKGIHTPPDIGSSATFNLKSGIKIYGGFQGNETILSQRDINNNITVLSGDLTSNDTLNSIGATIAINGTNSSHVVTAYQLDEETVLDGLVITGGSATYSGSTDLPWDGGGMLIRDSKLLRLSNIKLIGNKASWGAGIYSRNSGITITNCVFDTNLATSFGGGIYWEGPDLGEAPKLFVKNAEFRNNRGRHGGGIYAAPYVDSAGSPVVVIDSTFRNNEAWESGGAIQLSGSSSLYLVPEIENVTFFGNTAGEAGGAIRSSNLKLTKVTFDSNVAGGTGGGIYMSTGPNGISPTGNELTTLSHVAFKNNTAGGYGGGMGHSVSDGAILNYVVFKGNNSEYHGGGLYSGDETTIRGASFVGNSARLDGGGYYHNNAVNADLSNVVFSGNHAGRDGGAFYHDDNNATLTNVTINGNYSTNGGGIYSDVRASDGEYLTIANSIIWGNDAINGPQLFNASSDPIIITYSNIQGGYPGIGNTSRSPGFISIVNPNNAPTIAGNLRLNYNSTLIDSGSNSVVILNKDRDGNPRIMDGDHNGSAVVDMGAYERVGPIIERNSFQPWLFLLLRSDQTVLE